ncbi:MAG: DUF5723 family protein [Bacteroidota bacterium]
MNLFQRLIVSSCLITGLGLHAGAQVSNSLYFMKGVPQSNRVNPAYQPACNFYIGIPLLAPLRNEESSNPFVWNDIFYPHPSEDSMITFLHPLGDKEAFLNKLKSNNYITSMSGTSLLSFGFRTEAGYFSMDVTTRFEGGVNFPGDLGKLLLSGAEDGKSYQLNGLSADLWGFDEVSLGWSGAILDNLKVGVRGKLLFGVGNLSTVNSDLTLHTSKETWHLQSDMRVAASLPFANVSYDEEGRISDISLKDDVENLDPWRLPKYAFNPRNFGLGLDLGVEYRPLDNLLLSASFLDLGYIKWKDEVHELSYTTDYEFSGFELDPLEFSEEFTFGDYLDSSFNQLTDSLEQFLEFTPGGFYTRRLNSKLYVGASYSLTPGINFSLLSRTDFLSQRLSEQITASANFAVNSLLNLTVSYSYIDSYFKNIGAGFSLNAGPVNLYLISDNALNLIFWPQDTRAVNVWFGLNLVFGCKQIDRPLVY